jgi:hypothetical protein
MTATQPDPNMLATRRPGAAHTCHTIGLTQAMPLDAPRNPQRNVLRQARWPASPVLSETSAAILGEDLPRREPASTSSLARIPL